MPRPSATEDVFRAVVAGGFTLVELREGAMTLEDIFVKLTTREEAEQKTPSAKQEAA